MMRFDDLRGALGVTRCFGCHQPLSAARRPGVAPGFCSAQCQEPWTVRRAPPGRPGVADRITVRVRPEVHALLRQGGTEDGRGMADVARSAIRRWLQLDARGRREVLLAPRTPAQRTTRIVVMVPAGVRETFGEAVAAEGFGPSAALARILEEGAGAARAA